MVNGLVSFCSEDHNSRGLDQCAEDTKKEVSGKGKLAGKALPLYTTSFLYSSYLSVVWQDAINFKITLYI